MTVQYRFVLLSLRNYYYIIIYTVAPKNTFAHYAAATLLYGKYTHLCQDFGEILDSLQQIQVEQKSQVIHT